MFIASHWKCHSRRVSSCRFLPIPTTHLSYNFPNTSFLPSLCPGLGTRPFHTPVLGASRKKDKQGTQQLVLSICSLPPSCPYPCLTFALASDHILSSLTLVARCQHINPSLSPPLFFKKKFGFVPLPLSFRALFLATDSSLPPLPPHTSMLCSLSFLFVSSCDLRTQLFLPRKTTLSDKDPQRCLDSPNRTPILTCTFAQTLIVDLKPTPTLVLHCNVDASGVIFCQVVSFLSFCAVSIRQYSS